MNEKALRILEYPKIIDMLTGYASSPMGKELCRNLMPSSDISEILQAQMETSDALTRVMKKGSLSFSGIRDIRGSLLRLKVGSTVGMAELLNIAATLDVALRAKSYGRREADDDDQDSLEGLFAQIEPLSNLNHEIRRCIIDEETMADDASPTLKSIRRQIKLTNERIHSQLASMVSSQNIGSKLQDNLVTMRNGRYCLPVKAEYRSQVQGMIHDQSSTGSTLFIEPMAVVKLNNDLRELGSREKEEIEHILDTLSELAGESAVMLEQDIAVLTRLDFVFAKASLSRTYNGSEPVFNENGYIHIKKGRHPLLDKKKVVPIDLILGKDYRMLIVTGPNTGGKTVSLKTVGLFTLMGQAGLHIPAFDHSELAIFDDVFADIGDEQSIEQSLSTFSAHMRNIVNILNNIEHDDLLLLDEVGSGTDPEEGAALAMSILERLMEIGACTVATTHYNELKTFAYSKEGIENACVEFDIKSLRPTYRLLIGTPGASNAFAISKRLGLSDTLILRAQQLIKADHAQFENVLNTLENEKLMYEQKNADIAERQQRIEKLEKQLADMKQEMAKKKEQTLRKTKEQCASLLRRTRRESEEIIKELKAQFNDQGMKKRQETIDAARHKLRGRLDKVSQQNDDPNKPGEAVDIKTIAVGDIVYVNKLRQKGTITDISGKELTVQLGSLKMNVKAKDCSFVSHAVKVKETAPSKKAGGFNMLAKVSQISTEVDIRGLMVDEAIEVVSKYLDDAVISGLSRVLIIHGKGTGALRKGIQEYLKNHRNVLSYTLGDMDEGGSGVTAVKLK